MNANHFIAPQPDHFPPELRALPRWVTWRAEGQPGEKPRKVPHDAKALRAYASSTDPTTWASFAQAETAYLERVGEPDAFTGLGIVLDGDGLAGVDIDHCVTDGTPDPAALALLDALGAAYVELSPSGTGLRAFGYADSLERGAKGKLHGLDVELYTTGRYLTLTGQTIKAGPLAPLAGFAALAERIRSDRKVNPDTGEIVATAPDERHGQLVQRVLSGDVFHDSLRDLAASLVATGMQPGAVVNHLRGLMDASAAPRDERWHARRKQIPDLVSSAEKFAPMDFSALTGQAQAASDGDGVRVHPLSRFVDLDGEVKPPRWVIPGFIAQGVVVIAGAHGVGKSTALLPLAMVAAGLHGEGDALAPRHWRHVVYITEDVEQARRILAGIVGWGGLGLHMGTVGERLHIVEARRLEPAYAVQVSNTYREQFTRTVDGVEVLPLVVVDTKSAVLAQEEENSNTEGSEIMAYLKQDFQGLPVWVIGHVSKANLNRSNASELSMRGGSAFEADAHQVLYLVKEADERRYLVRGKTRFEAEWAELQIQSKTAATLAHDEFGNLETLVMRWGIASPPEQSRKEASEQAAEQQRKEDEAALRDEVRDAVATAWHLGNPLNRAGVKAKVRRKTLAVTAMIEILLSERWLHEVDVPAKVRAVNSKAAFLVSLTTEEHEAVLSGAGLPAAKLVIPESWQKQANPLVPGPVSEVAEVDHA